MFGLHSTRTPHERRSAAGTRGRACAVALALLWAAGAGAAGAGELEPEWVTRVPVGAALASGLADMVVDEAGISYITGTSGPSSNTDVTTAAVGPDGTVLWSHTWDGPVSWHDQARGIALGADGVVYVTGNTPAESHHANVLLLRYDAATGELLSSLSYTTGPGLSEHGADVVTDGNGTVYIAGGTVGDGADVLVLAFDANDELLWKRTWDGPTFAPYSQDHGREILFDPAGDLLVMIHGVMASQHPDFVVIKYAPADGATIWEANWGVSGGDFPRDMEVDALGDIYVTGTGIDFTDKYSTVKLLGVDGSLIWQAYDWSGIDDSARALALDGEGGVYVTGAVDHDGDHSNFNDNIYTVKRDATTGDLLWTHEYGDTCVGCYDVPSDVIVDPEGHAFVAGGTSSPPYASDVILMVLDAATGIETDRGVVSGGATESAGSGILAFDADYDLYDGGGTYDFNSGEITMSVTKWPSMMGGLVGVLFTDGFESGDLSAWSTVQVP